MHESKVTLYNSQANRDVISRIEMKVTNNSKAILNPGPLRLYLKAFFTFHALSNIEFYYL